MKKCILIIGLLVVAGCSSEVARWENAGTLVSVRPAEEVTRRPGKLGTALGEEELGLTRGLPGDQGNCPGRGSVCGDGEKDVPLILRRVARVRVAVRDHIEVAAPRSAGAVDVHEHLEIAVGVSLCVFALLLTDFADTRSVKLHRVGEYCEDDVLACKLVVFCELDCRDEISDTRYPEEIEFIDKLLWNAFIF